MGIFGRERATPWGLHSNTFGQTHSESQPAMVTTMEGQGFTTSQSVSSSMVPDWSNLPAEMVSKCRSKSTTAVGEVTARSGFLSGMSGHDDIGGASNKGAFDVSQLSSTVSPFPSFPFVDDTSLPCMCSALRHASAAGTSLSNDEQLRSFVSPSFSTSPAFPFYSSGSLADSAQAKSASASTTFPFSLSSSNQPQDQNQVSSDSRRPSQLSQSNRIIAPKPTGEGSETSPLSANTLPRTSRIVSEDGSLKDVVAISKAPYIRPSAPKKMCPHCKEHGDGFRGEHELRRHIDRVHAPLKKVWVCVDPTEENNFLVDCKACRNEKKYGAYYNAAAHLRRAHFNPRKRRGRGRGKIDEKRGGKGGGDNPSMDELKPYMKEIEVRVVPSDEKSDEESPQPNPSPSSSACKSFTNESEASIANESNQIGRGSSEFFPTGNSDLFSAGPESTTNVSSCLDDVASPASWATTSSPFFEPLSSTMSATGEDFFTTSASDGMLATTGMSVSPSLTFPQNAHLGLEDTDLLFPMQ